MQRHRGVWGWGQCVLAVIVAVGPAGCSDEGGGAPAGVDAAGRGDTSTGTSDARGDGFARVDGAQAGDGQVSDDGRDDGATPLPDTQSPDTTSPPIVTACSPGEKICEDMGHQRICAADGQSFGAPVACREDESCVSGGCRVRCPNNPKFGSYVGCEFWATDLPNYPDPTLNPTPENLPWAMVVSNPGSSDVRVAFEMPPLFSYQPADDLVPAATSRVFQLPNINVQGTSLMPKGVHLVASGPVLTHMFNPWDNRFSNDASLLLPDPMLGTDYVIMAWPTAPLDLVQIPGFPTPPNQNGYFTVIAAYDRTTVTFTVTAPVRASGAIPKLAPGESHTVVLARGAVLSIQADPETLTGPADITGSLVRADKPIAVFGGHEEAVVGDPVPGDNGGTKSPCCADHLEEQMLPVRLLDSRYFAVKSPPRGTTQIENDFWRIQAAADNITVTTSPPQPGAASVTLAKKGQFALVKTSQSFEIIADGPIQVGQFLTSRDTTEDFTGDASMLMLTPASRYRKDYAFAVPEGYTKLWATIVKPSSAAVTIDGVAVAPSTFAPLGDGTMVFGYVALTPGYHVASGDARFGLAIYGYSNAVSFSYSGGIAAPGE